MKVSYRGWAGHFICADRCFFRLNTLIEHDGVKVVVSTVGRMKSADCRTFEEIGLERHFETMVFYADDSIYNDAIVGKQIYLRGAWAIKGAAKELEANKMHEDAVQEVCDRILNGTLEKEE